MITQIKKRDGSVVPFAADKIRAAVTKSFVATRGGIESKTLDPLLADVLATLTAMGEGIPAVDDVQNAVEATLMQADYFDVAKAYIIYRYEHAKRREAEPEMQIVGPKVIKRSGEAQRFNKANIVRTLELVAGEVDPIVDFNALAEQVRRDIYDGITTAEVFGAIIMATRAHIERDPAYSKVAARLLAHKVYLEAGHGLFDAVDPEPGLRQTFIRGITRGVSIGLFDPRLLKFDLEALSKMLMPARDQMFDYLGIQTLYDRYFARDAEVDQLLETPQAFWMRVAMGLAINEPEREKTAKRFYEAMSTLRFVPSTPTLFHAGTTHPQLSSCYLTTVEDSLEHIFKSISDNAILSKWSGGLGNDWTNIRGTGSLIHGTGVDSQGVIPFLKIANDTTAAINRSGKRRGATCAYLEVWHYDIESFAELRKNTGDERRRTHDMDTAAWIPDLFMKRVAGDGDWTLLSTDEAPDLHDLYGKAFEKRYEYYEEKAKNGKLRTVKTLKARVLWQKLLSMLFETGHPWITFKDPSNLRSPQDHVGVVHSSNLCTEITLNTSAEETAVCNLGSINLAMHVKNSELDEAMIADTTATGLRMLDNVVDINFYPTPEAKRSNMRHRPVGLGVMGFQDALYQLGISFASEAAVTFSDTSMELISYHAILASARLAGERGAYATFRGSKWDRGLLPLDTLDILEQERGIKIDVPRTSKLDWSLVRHAIREHGMRNSNCLAIAPTATISNIVGSTPSIEPIYKNLYVKANQGGDFVVINNYLVEDLKKRGIWGEDMLKKLKYRDGSVRQIAEIPEELRDKYRETFEVEPEWVIRAAAVRGKWIDQSQSLNIFYAGSSGKDLNTMYTLAWRLGLKTTYYLRTLAASQVEKSTVSTAEFGVTHMRGVEEKLEVKQQAMIAQDVPKVVADDVKQIVGAGSMATMPEPKLVAMHLASDPNLKLCRIDDPDCEACQ